MSLTVGVTLTSAIDGISNLNPTYGISSVSDLRMPEQKIRGKSLVDSAKSQTQDIKRDDPRMPTPENTSGSSSAVAERKFDYNTDEKIEKITDLLSAITEEMLNQELIVGYVKQEKEVFDEWVQSKGGSVEQIQEIDDLVDNFRSGRYHSNDNINTKIQHIMSFIPDIIQAIAKREGVAAGIKAASGTNPIIDETKFVIEKIAPKILEKISTAIESKFEGEAATKITGFLRGLGDKLSVLPSKVLETLGPADIIASILDTTLGLISSGTGSYREINHKWDDIVGSIPVIGSLFGATMSVRDLLDQALGFGLSEAESFKKIRDTLKESLWDPTIEEYNASVENLAGLADQLDDLRSGLDTTDYNTAQDLISLNLDADDDDIVKLVVENLGIEYDFDVEDRDVYESAMTKVDKDIETTNKEIANYRKRLQEVSGGYGAEGRLREGLQTSLNTRLRLLQQLTNTKSSIQENLDKAIKNDDNAEKLYKIGKIIDLYRGRITQEELDKILNPEKDISITPSFTHIEMQARQQLEQIFLIEKQLTELDSYINQLKKEDNEIKEYLIMMAGSLAGGLRLSPDQAAERQRRIYNKQQRQQAIRTEVEDILSKIPAIQDMMENMQTDLQQTIEDAAEQDVDLSFLEQSLNFDEYLQKLTDDSRYWESLFSNFYQLRGGFDPRLGFM